MRCACDARAKPRSTPPGHAQRAILVFEDAKDDAIHRGPVVSLEEPLARSAQRDRCSVLRRVAVDPGGDAAERDAAHAVRDSGVERGAVRAAQRCGLDAHRAHCMEHELCVEAEALRHFRIARVAAVAPLEGVLRSVTTAAAAPAGNFEDAKHTAVGGGGILAVICPFPRRAARRAACRAPPPGGANAIWSNALLALHDRQCIARIREPRPRGRDEPERRDSITARLCHASRRALSARRLDGAQRECELLL